MGFKTVMPDPHRLFGYDLLKALTMVGIVFYHLGSIRFDGIPQEGQYIPDVGKFLYGLLSASVPMFFMVNGAIVGNKDVPIRKCVMNALRLVLIGIFWTVFFKCFLYPILWGDAPTTNLWDLWRYYWFFYTYSAVSLITWVLNRHAVIRYVVIGCLFIFPFLTNFVWDIVLYLSPDTALPSWGHSGAMTLYTILYYYIGRFLAKVQTSSWLCILPIALGLLLVNFEVFVMTNSLRYVFDSVSSCLPTIGAIFINVGFFLLLKDCLSKDTVLHKVISFLGQRTLGIYLFHSVFVFSVRHYLFQSSCQNPLVVFLAAVFICLISASLWQLLGTYLKQLCIITTTSS